MIEHGFQHDGRTWHVREYDLGEYLDAGAKHPHAKNREHWYQRICDHRDPDVKSAWRGGSAGTAENLRTWPDGRAYLERYNLDGLTLPSVKSRRRRRRWADDGDEFDRDRFDAGHDDCWQTRRRVTRDGGGIVRVTIELCVDWKKAAADLIWSGAAALKLCDRLEDAGYRVAIDVTVSVRDLDRKNGYRAAEVIHCKGPQDPLNLDALLLAAACPMFFRFHVLCGMYRRPVRATKCTGRVAQTPEPVRGDVHIAKVTTQRDAERVVREALAQVNGRSEAA